MDPQTAATGRGKDKMVAGLLGIFLGGFGIHQFYLGSNVTGVIEIVLLPFCLLGAVLGLVEGIMILVMPQEEFDARYNRRTPASVEFVFMKPKT
jgi:TM2 domain-containing membrane protein YozV